MSGPFHLWIRRGGKGSSFSEFMAGNGWLYRQLSGKVVKDFYERVNGI